MREQTAIVAADLVRRCRICALGTLHEGAPSVSMAPYAILEDPFAFLVLVSALSAHTGDMLTNPSVALMIVEPETAAKAPHALARVSVQGRARPIAKADPGYAAARASYTGRFADMAGLFELGDFTLVAIDPATARVVAGFARAATITPASLAQCL